MQFKAVATIICDNEWLRGGKPWGCTDTAQFTGELNDPEFEAKAQKHFEALGWQIDPARCPYCRDGRPHDEE